MRGSCYHACNDYGMTCAGRFSDVPGIDACANYDAGANAGKTLRQLVDVVTVAGGVFVVAGARLSVLICLPGRAVVATGLLRR